ncbi:MAG: ribosome small subunit-dependent GTPase A [Thermoanaerobaculales bacterium]|nr:ribosome small subunit-dependent GTPase A [Thermoanaerobaculales bacterium]
MEILEGTVIAMHGPLVRVQAGGQTLVVASRRRLNWEGGSPPAARLVVGDRVSLELKDEDGVIVAVHARRSSLLRRAPASHRAEVLAANVDQALLVFAAREPPLKQGLLDRFLVACSLSGIAATIVVNKLDQGLAEIAPLLAVYQGLGYTVRRVSARSGWGLGEIKRLLVDRTSLFCGPSGAGKSSLLNAVYPGFRLRVGELSESTGKGRHTTSLAELMPLPYGGFVVDTPGLKEFGVWEAETGRLLEAFPEIARHMGSCRFADCRHRHEPDCAVRAAVESGGIDPGRYASFIKILDEAAE